jgi:hypothetical protein
MALWACKSLQVLDLVGLETCCEAAALHHTYVHTYGWMGIPAAGDHFGIHDMDVYWILLRLETVGITGGVGTVHIRCMYAAPTSLHTRNCIHTAGEQSKPDRRKQRKKWSTHLSTASVARDEAIRPRSSS